MDKVVSEIIARLNLSEANCYQVEIVEQIRNPFRSVWTTVYDCGHIEKNTPAIFACFASPELKDSILSGQDWIKHPGDFHPGFSGFRDNAKYEECNDDGFEYIVEEEYFYQLDFRQLHFNPEFIMLFNLFREDDGSYSSIDSCGEKESVIRVVNDRVEYKTSYLLRYMSAKQLLFVQFIDSRFESSKPYPHNTEVIEKQEQRTDNCNYFLILSSTPKRDYLFSMIYARSIVEPPEREKCELPPFEKEEEYPEFIIGERPDGSFVKFTCKEDKLANHFGANPDAPHYLTPIYFKPAVLDKYRKNPLFEVTERRLSCGHQWGVEIDNVDPTRVMVFLGDLGRDLPQSERFHFEQYQISPTDQQISPSVFANDFCNIWTDPSGPVSKFFAAYNDLCKAWQNKFGRSLFRQFHEDDANVPRQIRVPTSNNPEEFETVVLSLTKLLVDYIDESQLPPLPNKKGISKLEHFLIDQGISIDVSPLRNLQDLRSEGTAHAKGKKYDKTKAKMLSGNAVEDTVDILGNLTDFMNQFALALSYKPESEQMETDE